jgi:hypothetical protein
MDRVIEHVHILRVQIGRNVAGHLASFQFTVKGRDHLILNVTPAGSVDGMGNVGVQFQPLNAIAVVILLVTTFVETITAMVAISGPQMIFIPAAGAVIGEFPGWHGQEKPILSINQFDIPHHKRLVKG